MDDATLREMWDSHKTLFGLFKQQEARIDFVFRRQSGLIDALRKALGLPGEDESAPTPVIDTDAVAKLKAGLEELERMFNHDDKEGLPGGKIDV
jgi:hypothetical protein